jgi:hypothetical protein
VVRLNPQARGAQGPKMRGTMSRAVDAHLRYLERDGVTRDGERGKAIPRSRTRPTARRLWRAAGRIVISFASSRRPRMQVRWATFAASPVTSCARWN